MLKNNLLKIDINELIDKEIFLRSTLGDRNRDSKKAEHELKETQLVVV